LLSIKAIDKTLYPIKRMTNGKYKKVPKIATPESPCSLMLKEIKMKRKNPIKCKK
jgi:hypothetical protein